MRTRTYGGVGGRKTKVGRKLTFVFLLPDYNLQQTLEPTRSQGRRRPDGCAAEVLRRGLRSVVAGAIGE